MSHPFNSKHGPILVEAEVTGPDRSMTLPLLLDTGATTSLIKESVLLALGYDLANVTDRVRMTTGSGPDRPEGDPDKVDDPGPTSVRIPRSGLFPARERVGVWPARSRLLARPLAHDRLSDGPNRFGVNSPQSPTNARF